MVVHHQQVKDVAAAPVPDHVILLPTRLDGVKPAIAVIEHALQATAGLVVDQQDRVIDFRIGFFQLRHVPELSGIARVRSLHDHSGLVLRVNGQRRMIARIVTYPIEDGLCVFDGFAGLDQFHLAEGVMGQARADLYPWIEVIPRLAEAGDQAIDTRYFQVVARQRIRQASPLIGLHMFGQAFPALEGLVAGTVVQ